MAAVLKRIPRDHLLFGSDIPFFTIERIAAAVNKFEVSGGLANDSAGERCNCCRIEDVKQQDRLHSLRKNSTLLF
jgi:predicted TIM-barrel fold metal-dependent hydrolase